MLSEDDIKNGWTEESLDAYLRQREYERSIYGQENPVGGFQVTAFQRARPPIRMESILDYHPFAKR